LRFPISALRLSVHVHLHIHKTARPSLPKPKFPSPTKNPGAFTPGLSLTLILILPPNPSVLFRLPIFYILSPAAPAPREHRCQSKNQQAGAARLRHSVDADVVDEHIHRFGTGGGAEGKFAVLQIERQSTEVEIAIHGGTTHAHGQSTGIPSPPGDFHIVENTVREVGIHPVVVEGTKRSGDQRAIAIHLDADPVIGICIAGAIATVVVIKIPNDGEEATALTTTPHPIFPETGQASRRDVAEVKRKSVRNIAVPNSAGVFEVKAKARAELVHHLA